MMYKLAKEMKGIQIIHKNLPLDTECNPYLQAPFHQGSCINARYAIAAEKQGKFWEMNSILFDKKPQTEDDILGLVKNMNFDIGKLQADANSPETAKEIKEQIKYAYNNGINGTPATIINGKIDIGIKPYNEYKEMVKKLGAEER